MPLGWHMQNTVPDWLSAVALLPSGTWVKAVDSVQLLHEAKQVNPGIKTVLRHWYDSGQVFGGDLATNKNRARLFLNTFVDGTFRQYASSIDAIEEFNEYLANSQSAQEIQDRVTWVRAISEVWTQEYRTQAGLGHIRLVIANAPIGNDIPLEIARQCYIHNNILSYHAYIPVLNNVITPANEWNYYSGRWTALDSVYAQNGVFVNWLFTEMGSVANVGGHLDPAGGWRAANVHNGHVSNYLAALGYWLDRYSAWNSAHNSRAYGGVLFTTSGQMQSTWRNFEVIQPEMGQIATFVRNWTPGAPTPPEPSEDWKKEVWNESVVRQPITLNPGAALQAAIFADGLTPVQSEFWFTPSDGVQRACQAAEHIQTGERRVYYAIVPQWNDVSWFRDPHVPMALASPVEGIPLYVTSPFNSPRDYGLHEGIDLRAVLGTTPVRILACAPGTVEFVRTTDTGDYGKYVRLNHGNGVKTWYCHMSSVIVTVGLVIPTGYVLGRAGDTGNATGVHLHLNVQHIGHGLEGYVVDDVIDPAPLLGID